jgi:hypothetical protein
MQWTPCPNSSRWPHTSSSDSAGQCLSLKTPLVGCLVKICTWGTLPPYVSFLLDFATISMMILRFLIYVWKFPAGLIDLIKKRASEKSTDSTEELRTMDSPRSSHLTMSGSTVLQSLKSHVDSGSLLKASCFFNSTDLCSPMSTEVT